jgi:predicted DNA-binding transcriptional regulator AlpA
MDEKLAVSMAELAELVGGHLSSMRNRYYAHPEEFPPAVFLPGVRGARFLLAEFPAWFESKKAPPALSTHMIEEKTTAKRGRRRKASGAQIAKAKSEKKW